MIHFELMLGERYRSILGFSFVYDAPADPASFAEKTIFVPLYCFLILFQRPTDHVNLFQQSPFCSIDLFVYSFTDTTVSDYYSLSRKSSNQIVFILILFLLFHYCVGYSGSLDPIWILESVCTHNNFVSIIFKFRI